MYVDLFREKGKHCLESRVLGNVEHFCYALN